MIYRPPQKCDYRDKEGNCIHLKIGFRKFLGIILGNKKCFQLGDPTYSTCQHGKPFEMPVKPTAPPAPPPIKAPLPSLLFKYACKHRDVHGVCSKLNLTATHGSNICTETANVLSECPYHDNYKGYVPDVGRGLLEPIIHSELLGNMPYQTDEQPVKFVGVKTFTCSAEGCNHNGKTSGVVDCNKCGLLYNIVKKYPNKGGTISM